MQIEQICDADKAPDLWTEADGYQVINVSNYFMADGREVVRVTWQQTA